jgi:5-methylcytosine-specific restriction enzyme subunit McrC
VARPILHWRRDRPGADEEYLPQMRTDLVLSSAGRVIVADAKYYRETLTERLGKRSINSGNLYQLFAYLSNHRVDVGGRELSGLLIYPRTTESVWIDVVLHSYPVRVASIDLSRQWNEIAADLLRLVHAAVGERHNERA